MLVGEGWVSFRTLLLVGVGEKSLPTEAVVRRVHGSRSNNLVEWRNFSSGTL